MQLILVWIDNERNYYVQVNSELTINIFTQCKINPPNKVVFYL